LSDWIFLSKEVRARKLSGKRVGGWESTIKGNNRERKCQPANDLLNTGRNRIAGFGKKGETFRRIAVAVSAEVKEGRKVEGKEICEVKSIIRNCLLQAPGNCGGGSGAEGDMHGRKGMGRACYLRLMFTILKPLKWGRKRKIQRGKRLFFSVIMSGEEVVQASEDTDVIMGE